MSACPIPLEAGKDIGSLDYEEGTIPVEAACDASTRNTPVKQDTCSSACGDAELPAQDRKSSPDEGEEPCRTSHRSSLVSENLLWGLCPFLQLSAWQMIHLLGPTGRRRRSCRC